MTEPVRNNLYVLSKTIFCNTPRSRHGERNNVQTTRHCATKLSPQIQHTTGGDSTARENSAPSCSTLSKIRFQYAGMQYDVNYTCSQNLSAGRYCILLVPDAPASNLRIRPISKRPCRFGYKAMRIWRYRPETARSRFNSMSPVAVSKIYAMSARSPLLVFGTFKVRTSHLLLQQTEYSSS